MNVVKFWDRAGKLHRVKIDARPTRYRELAPPSLASAERTAAGKGWTRRGPKGAKARK
jgi:hypothetical protein